MLQVNCFFPFPTSFFILFLWLLPHPLSSVQLTPTVSSVCTCSASFFPLMVLPPPPFSIYAEGQGGKSGLAKGHKRADRSQLSEETECLVFSGMCQESYQKERCSISIDCWTERAEEDVRGRSFFNSVPRLYLCCHDLKSWSGNIELSGFSHKSLVLVKKKKTNSPVEITQVKNLNIWNKVRFFLLYRHP